MTLPKERGKNKMSLLRERGKIPSPSRDLCET